MESWRRLSEVAREVGVSTITLKRWLLSGKVQEVPRDRNGWRLFSSKDVDRIRRYATRMSPPAVVASPEPEYHIRRPKGKSKR
jgi:predicted site-specific integrase-resolvase